MTFEQWYLQKDQERDGCSPQDDVLMGLDKDGVAQLVMDAFIAGWNSCRDKWGGMDYEETEMFEEDYQERRDD